VEFIKRLLGLIERRDYDFTRMSGGSREITKISAALRRCADPRFYIFMDGWSMARSVPENVRSRARNNERLPWQANKSCRNVIKLVE
jgi:hypothetical protein